MRILTEFAIQGHFRRFPYRIAQEVQLPKPFVDALQAHERFCCEYLRLRSSTVLTRTRNLRRFLQFLHYSRRISTLKELRPADLSEYVLVQQHKKPAAIARCLADIRSFLRHLAMQGIVPQDLVKALPKIRVPSLATIPPIWEAEELDKLLAARHWRICLVFGEFRPPIPRRRRGRRTSGAPGDQTHPYPRRLWSCSPAQS